MPELPWLIPYNLLDEKGTVRDGSAAVVNPDAVRLPLM